MNYRIDKSQLLERLNLWNTFLKKKVSLIACGGTALTLLGVKPSTKDIDLIVPNENEHSYLIRTLQDLGYKSVSGWGWAKDEKFIFDLFRGKRVHTTELLESPLKQGNHILIKEFNYLYLGVLNYYDLIISKLFRATSLDIEDCIALFRAKKEELNVQYLKERFKKTASFDVSEKKVNKNLEYFLKVLKNEGEL
ncbi:MAG: hypothetical protein B5M48_01160 [Candidatus Omnitrophica bacterium 4484_213]|nr:MAG: hypothetical protein B5M48_01160 [Candidatus Omnitrophica bacterium 4484_213]